MKTKIILTIEGGIVQAIGSNSQDVEVSIIDFDDQSEQAVSINTGYTPDYYFQDGKAHIDILQGVEFENLSKKEQLIVTTLKENNV